MAVSGPHASVVAGVRITNAVVRNSIIDTGAEIATWILDSALVGEKAKVTGRGKALFVGDNSYVELG
jgi:glucose-1-phosphate thymidylyltransferase